VALTVRSLARRWLPGRFLDRIARLHFDDRGHGYDRFGLNPEWVGLGLLITSPLYDAWFRVTSTGAEHIPATGGAVLACNHSGTLPFDAMMVWADVIRHTEPPRVPRVIMDYFVNVLPFVSTLFVRGGAVGGSRGNMHQLLEAGELVLLFPEGVPGISKSYQDRYQLRSWRVGHAEMAIQHGVPVVPTAVIGAEEQMPQLGRIEAIKLFGAPYLPVTASPVPLPVHYHLYYGEPIPVHQDYRPDQCNDPAVVHEASERVKAAVELLIDRGLSERQGVFR
jgi:1-acyl-sn-glycerol-3-phosphate acyltransferase